MPLQLRWYPYTNNLYYHCRILNLSKATSIANLHFSYYRGNDMILLQVYFWYWWCDRIQKLNETDL